MNLTRDRLRSIGWAALLITCLTLLVALTFRVNAVKSQVRLTERQIVAVKREKMFLETEFLTRANQQQLLQSIPALGDEPPVMVGMVASKSMRTSISAPRQSAPRSMFRWPSASVIEGSSFVSCGLT